MIIVDEWYDKLDKVKAFMIDNNKRPSSRSKDATEKKLGEWIGTQIKNYPKRQYAMAIEEKREKWEAFMNDNKYKQYMIVVDEWYDNLDKVKAFMIDNNKRPSSTSKDATEKKLGIWISNQIQNYPKQKESMAIEEKREKWEAFMNDDKYKQYMIIVDEWYDKLDKVKAFMIDNNKRPSLRSKDATEKKLGGWISHQLTNYSKRQYAMAIEEKREKWRNFISQYPNLFKQEKKDEEETRVVLKKKTTINKKQEKIMNEKEVKERKLSKYQEIGKNISTQRSDTTVNMFANDETLWHHYHDYRDESFKGYDNQDEIPLNKIKSYLRTKLRRKLRILDLGCGRNLIQDEFKENDNFSIIGYDHVSYNGSLKCDICRLPDENESVDICVFSQSLMGSNWKDYIKEALRVLRFNGELIISESVERYDVIKNYINELNLCIKSENYVDTNRWFYLNIINDNV